VYETFKASYTEMHQAAGLMGGDEELEARLHRVKRWLDSSDSGEWVIVIDNFDNAADLTLKKYLPATRGTILFTTRDKRLTGPTAYVGTRYGVEIREMSDKEAVDTLSQLLSSDRAVVEAHAEPGKHAQLLTLLENLPLAIAQAAAYINSTDMTVSEYLDLFICAQPQLLSKPLMAMVEHEERASRAVMTTWKITRDQIQSANPISIWLLELMSFFNIEEIPEEMIKGAAFFKNQSPIVFSDAIEPLITFSLLYRLCGSSNFRLHRLVSFWVRTQMGLEDTLRKAERLQMALVLVLDAIPCDPQDDLRKCVQLKSHAVAVVEHAGSMEFESVKLADLLECLGHITDGGGDYVEAQKWYQQALGGKEKVLGNGHPSTLSTVNSMAVVFNKKGEYGKALEWYQWALDGKEKALGKHHPSTLDTINNMANVFSAQGGYGKALEWYQRALDGKEKALGNVHPSTLETINNIAIVLMSQGEYDKALEWYQRALDGKETVLGNGHPSTLATINNMANVFSAQGGYGKALEWYQRALDGKETALGNGHPSTLETINNMATVFFDQGEYDKALEWYQRALDGREKALGNVHPSTLDTINNMATVFSDQGEYGKALEWYQRALDGREKALGKDHPSTLDTINNMANVFSDQGEYGKALEWYQRALDGKEKALGKDHPSTIRTKHNIELLKARQGLPVFSN